MDNYRPLDITVISASGLDNFLFSFRMRVYVVVSLLNGNSVVEKRTHSSQGQNPKWNHRIKFPIEESAIHTTTLLFVLRQQRMCGDKDIGEVSIPVSELLETNSSGSEHVVDYQVQSLRGKSVGTFTFSHQFRDKVCPATASSHPPATTYQQGMVPAYHQSPGYANYPQYGTGVGWYNPPTAAPPGYANYPPQQVGYNHQIEQQQPKSVD
ncbi:protein SRC2 homolog [Bidens hawaiensis]|uniref:protein SRC2 homolog n=1 Tax=Bidens hawaiensis TaxID=980011 RepID=UPI0040498A2C